MDRQPAAIHIIRLLTQQVEKLGVGHSNQKIHAILGIAHYEEQGCLAISEGVQFQLVIGSQVPDLLNVKNRGPGRRADKDTFGCFTCGELVFFILAHRKVSGLAAFQLLEHQIHRVFKFLIVLPDLHRVNHFQQGGEVLFLRWGLIVDIADQRRKQ